MKLKYFIISTFLLLFCHIPAYAYIDPGTGSMLFSVVLGISATVFFLFQTLIIKIKTLSCYKKEVSNTSIPIVIYSEGNQYFRIFKPILDEFEKREHPVVFYTSQEDDLVFKANYKYVKSLFIGQGFKGYAKLAFMKADVCLMTTPNLDVLQLKRSKDVKYYCHIFHGISSCLQYRLFSLDYYDAVLCDGEFQFSDIRELEEKRNLPAKELVVVGSPYMDMLKGQVQTLTEKSEMFTILVAPTWGPSGILSKYGTKLLDKLIESNWRIIIRPHPQSVKVEKEIIDSLVNHYKDYSNVSWNYDVDNLKVLSEADIMISDFSCTIFEYCFLFNRPVIYINQEMNKEIYDIGDLDNEAWRYKAIRKVGKELTKDNFENIIQMIESISVDDDLYSRISETRKVAWEQEDKGAENIVNYLINKQKEIIKC